jgi:hypothetical protein
MRSVAVKSGEMQSGEKSQAFFANKTKTSRASDKLQSYAAINTPGHSFGKMNVPGNRMMIQPKLTINQPGDRYEEEADEMADRVMRMPDPAAVNNAFKPSMSTIQRKCAECEEEDVQRKEMSGFIQKEEKTSESATPAARPLPDFKLTMPGLLKQPAQPDFLAMRQPFINRNIFDQFDPDSALQVWHYNFNFFTRFGVPPDLSIKIANFTAPLAIDAQLKAGHPTWWELTDRDMNTTTRSISIPVLDFDANFSPKAPAWWNGLFGNDKKVQRKCAQCDGDKKKLTRKEINSSSPAASDPLYQYIDNLGGSGQALPKEVRNFYEPRFGYDFSKVRIHHDNSAAQSADSINALAYTSGNNIIFNRGQYAPGTASGKKLLGHELTHVVQQGAGIRRAPMPKDRFGRPLGVVSTPEQEAYDRDTFKIAENEKIEAPLKAELRGLVKNAVWSEIRRRIYPKESSAGLKRADDRHSGKLPDLTGLGGLKTIEHFVQQIRKVKADWNTTLNTPNLRVKELGKVAGDELVTVGVPGFLIVDKEPMQSKGFFQAREWKYVISEELVKNDQLADADAQELANVTLHESRHAEQTFLAARFSAGIGGKDAAGIVAEQRIPIAIANDAVLKKFDSNTDAKTLHLGKKMHQAKVTNRATIQGINTAFDDILAKMDAKRKETEMALSSLVENATPAAIKDAKLKRDELKTLVAALEVAYTNYRNIPSEADAHEVGDAAGLAFTGWKKP